MTNKITVVTICRNEMGMIEHTLPQSLKWADNVIVLDGGPENTSTDGTWEYLQSLKWLKLVDDKGVEKNCNNKKLYIETGTYGSDHTIQKNWDRLMRQRYLDILEDLNYYGWIFLIDADETYTDEDWKKIKEYVKIATEKEQVMIRFPYIYFFKDLDHIVTGGSWSVPCHHLSVYRPGFQYLDVSTLIRDEVGHCITHYPKDKIMYVNDVTLYHYSHCADYEKQRQRIWRYSKRGDLGPEVMSKMPNNVKDWEWKDDREKELAEEKIREYKGTHPIHMLKYVKDYNKKYVIK